MSKKVVRFARVAVGAVAVVVVGAIGVVVVVGLSKCLNGSSENDSKERERERERERGGRMDGWIEVLPNRSSSS